MDKKKIKKTPFPYRIINPDDPPAPALNVDVIGNNVEKKGVLALLDSGAGITLIPQNIIEEIQPSIIDSAISLGGIGGKAESLLYALKIRIPKVGAWYVEVVGYAGVGYVLIGRDMLNKWSLFLKGRSRIFEIS
jgi:hypothetical protein